MTTEPTTGPTGTEQRVCELIAQRQQAGIAKYGMTVADNPLAIRSWLQHALEETLDQAIYLKRAIEEIDAAPVMKVVRIYTDHPELALSPSASIPDCIGEGDDVMLMACRKG